MFNSQKSASVKSSETHSEYGSGNARQGSKLKAKAADEINWLIDSADETFRKSGMDTDKLNKILHDTYETSHKEYLRMQKITKSEMIEPTYPEFWFWGAVDAAKLGVAGVEAMGALTKPGFSLMHRWGVFETKSVVQVATKHPLSGLSPENVLRLTDELGLETSKNQLILWSGLGRGNAGIKLSQEFARANGRVTLEMTKGGSWLNEMDLFGPNSPFTFKEAIKIWEGVSTKMVQQSSGQVRSVIGQVRPTSIYRAEQSEILMNTKITGLDELHLKPRFTFGNN